MSKIYLFVLDPLMKSKATTNKVNQSTPQHEKCTLVLRNVIAKTVS